ncbi:hypothetical protein HMPREF3226_00803 [Prevotella corporis]|uniref:Uncharacterized protein n=1 Tax=Prevotella corporis TaxID=28128 RepID=A0A133QF10_9BACT|nr:hypothetical protein HMPREF3226_00803 [Prevotella corporis]
MLKVSHWFAIGDLLRGESSLIIVQKLTYHIEFCIVLMFS